MIDDEFIYKWLLSPLIYDMDCVYKSIFAIIDYEFESPTLIMIAAVTERVTIVSQNKTKQYLV